MNFWEFLDKNLEPLLAFALVALLFGGPLIAMIALGG